MGHKNSEEIFGVHYRTPIKSAGSHDLDAGYRQLAASVLVQAFNDLASPAHTSGVYAAFFFTDYCKELFECAGVTYDPAKIAQRIAERPKPFHDETFTRHSGRYTFRIVNGYIEEISDKRGDLYRLRAVGQNTGRVKYYWKTAFSMLYKGYYVIEEGV